MLFFYLLESSYIAFHDEEWGVPVHDDKYAYLTLYQLIVHVKPSDAKLALTMLKITTSLK